MANEFITRNGLISQNNSVVTGSLIVTAGITGSLEGTASYALTASYVLGGGAEAAFPYTGSAEITGLLSVIGTTTATSFIKAGITTGAYLLDNGNVSTALNSRIENNFIATLNQTVFPLTYEVGQLDVYYNGAKLYPDDFTATNGTSIILASGAPEGTQISTVKYIAALSTSAIRNETTFSTTLNQTTFTVNYTVGQVDVFYNGSKLNVSEFTATNGTSVVLGFACAAGESIAIVSYVNQVSGASGTTNKVAKFTGAASLGDSQIFDNGTNIGIGKDSPNSKLDVNGNTNITGSLRVTAGITGSLLGTATSLTTARTFQIGSTGKNFDGSANVSWTLSEIGAQSTLTNPVTGTGTTNYLPKFTGTSAIGNSLIFDNGTNVGIGITTPNLKLSVLGSSGAPASSGTAQNGVFRLTGGTGLYNVLDFGINETNDYSWIQSTRANNLAVYDKLALQPLGGNVGIGTITPLGKLNIFTGLSGATIDIPNQQLGSISFGNASFAATIPTIASKSDNNSGLYIISATNNTNPGPDMVLNARKTDNTDFTTLTSSAFRFSRFGTNLVDILRNGNVGIGTTSPSNLLSVGVTNSTTGKGITIESTGGIVYGRFGVINPTVDNDTYIGSISNNNFLLYSNSTERMRITSGGQVLVGATSDAYGDGSTLLSQSGGKAATFQTAASSGYTAVVLRRTQSQGGLTEHYYNSTYCGGISITTNTSAYGTSSDYRLKEDLKPIKGLDLISQVKVYDYKWKSVEDRAYGVIAHELQEVIPQAVIGEKDAEQMQGVDYSKLVPILVQAIQELKAEIEILKNK